jgi:hypothetical protein
MCVSLGKEPQLLTGKSPNSGRSGSCCLTYTLLSSCGESKGYKTATARMAPCRCCPECRIWHTAERGTTHHLLGGWNGCTNHDPLNLTGPDLRPCINLPCSASFHGENRDPPRRFTEARAQGSFAPQQSTLPQSVATCTGVRNAHAHSKPCPPSPRKTTVHSSRLAEAPGKTQECN